MKILLAALALLGCTLTQAETMGAKSSEAAVSQFTTACFKALNQEQWLDNARCYDAGQLADFQRLYLARAGEAAPGVVPQEFEAYFKDGITLERLKRIEPAAFFAAFNGGWSSLMAPRGPCARESSLFEVSGVQATSPGKFEVSGTTTARRTCNGMAEEKTRPERVVVRLLSGKPAIELPRHFFDLLQAAR